MIGLLPAISVVVVPHRLQMARAGWDWVFDGAAAVAAVFLVLLTGLIWRVYLKQSGIMSEQLKLAQEASETMQQQAAASVAGAKAMAEQAHMLYAQLTYSSAPLLCPTWDLHGAPDIWNRQQTTWVNLGSGIAMGIKAAAWEVNPEGLQPWQPRKLSVSPSYVPPGRSLQLRLETGEIAARAENAKLILHYQDFNGNAWHTTWNLAPTTAEMKPMDEPVVWNPAKWREAICTGRLWDLCPHCARLVEQWRDEMGLPTTPAG